MPFSTGNFALVDVDTNQKTTMKPSLSLRFALLAAAALFTTHAAFAGKPPPPPQPSSGTLVLNLPSAENWGLAAAPSGRIFAVASVYADYPDWRQVVLSSSDTGSTWSVLDDFAPPGFHVEFWGGLGGGIALDSTGSIYVSGLSYANDGIQADHWYVRRSTDSGATWTTVDDFALATVGTGYDDVGVAADAAGNVYVSKANGQVWTVRKGVGGTAFSTVDALPNSLPKDIFVHPTDGIFVVGTSQVTIKNQTSWAWLVRRSTDGGATWSNVDTYHLFSSYSAVAMGIGANASGIYVVGRANNANSSHWIVRKSANGGNAWTTVDDYQLVADNSNQARCIATDANGNLLVAGSGAGKWILRKSAGGTGPWTTVDVFQNFGFSTVPNAIAADAFGNVFVGGGYGVNWLIKRY